MGFMMAWGVHDADNIKNFKNDKNLVEYAPFLETFDTSTLKKTITPLHYHVCNEEDYAKFSTPRKQDKVLVNEYRSLKSLYCLDSHDKFGNYLSHEVGTTEAGINKKLVFSYRPCEP
jgi:hypothetical protein